MKRIFYFLILITTFLCLNGCVGYKPIFDSTSLNFKIVDYDITGEKKLGEQIFYKLNNLFKIKENSSNIKNVYISVNVTKNKNATSKDSAGKVLAYNVSISTKIFVKDLISGDEILKKDFISNAQYEVQSKYSETVKLEHKAIENILNKIYQDLLIKLLENIK